MSKWKFSKKVDLAHHKGNLNLHIVLFRLYFVVCVYHICSVRPMAAMDTGVFFLQHMTSSHGFVRAYCPITCSNLIKNIIWIIATNKIRNIYIYNWEMQLVIKKYQLINFQKVSLYVRKVSFPLWSCSL